MQQAVDTAQVHERTVVGDVLDHAFAGFALGQLTDEFGALFGTAFFQHGAARDHDIAARTVHFQDRERLFLVHQRTDIAHRANVHLGARQEGRGTTQIHREAALDATDDGAVDRLLLLEGLLEAVPALFAARLVARKNGIAQGIFDALEIDLDIVTHTRGFRARARELTQRDAAFSLEADVDHHEIVFNGCHGTFDDLAFRNVAAGKGCFQHRGKIIGRRGEGFSSHVKGLLRSGERVQVTLAGSPHGRFRPVGRYTNGRQTTPQHGHASGQAIWTPGFLLRNRLSASRLLALFHNLDGCGNGRVYTQGRRI